MRPLRFLFTIATCVLTFFFLLFIGPWRSSTTANLSSPSSDRRLGAYFNWRTPSSLFPPSAIISLTDDNSTFFLARPAAFGPLLPAKSLSSQLWVGSGFGDDHFGRRGEGELGCSDVPGWDGGEYGGAGGVVREGVTGKAEKESAKAKRDVEDESDGEKHPDRHDGTDDHLHHPLPASEAVRQNGEVASKKPAHADIQSLQEGAEIAGKIVLLSRGGCGFLEKVKWVQRRGGVALIVGDDIRGGPLVTMYARGDTSNITIPALFTSHTTAHLLSSLIPSGGAEEVGPEEAARLGLALGEKEGKGSKKGDKPEFTTTSAAVKATSTAKSRKYESLLRQEEDEDEDEVEKAGWFWSIFGRSGGSGRPSDSRRPPSSGNIDWVLQREFDDEEEIAATSTTAKHAPTKAAGDSTDGFRIGVQDWRDPDLVAEQKEQQQQQQKDAAGSTSTSQAVPHSSKAADQDGLKGGSITPGSGEYGKSAHQAVDIDRVASSKNGASPSKDTDREKGGKSRGWLSSLFSSSSSDDSKAASPAKPEGPYVAEPPVRQPTAQPHPHADHLTTSSALSTTPPEHQGLWITLTPTSMSSSPFFDTLLVLVVSPLVTLTVVYALLLLRSRIRRRRWRAPKSVVERLPVRTYQTIGASGSGSGSSATSSTGGGGAVGTGSANATTPLLPQTPSNSDARAIAPRARARTVSEVPVGAAGTSAGAGGSLDSVEEKRIQGLAEWRRRYGGRQRECVVCLEEYVDGVSRVMSLPCGHEFHEGCITPWLTTRRRTCPICKNDIVRSLTHHSSPSTHPTLPSSPPPPVGRAAFYHDPEEDEEQAALLANEEPGAQELVVSREVEARRDLEAGVDRGR